MYHTLAKSSKVPFVHDDIILLTSEEWALIKKEVRSEHGKRGIQYAFSSVANQMKLNTGEMPTLAAAASELGRRGNQGAVRSVANQMKLKTGEMPTLASAASKLGRSGGKRGFQGNIDAIVRTGIARREDAPTFC